MKHLTLFENFKYRMAGYGHGERPVAATFMYHATPALHLDTILTDGLVPREPAPGEPTGVYMTPDVSAVVKLCRLLNLDRKLKCDYVVLEVDTTGMKLFADPYAVTESGAYSLELVPAERIRVKTVVDFAIIRSAGNWKKFWDWWFWGQRGREKPEFAAQFDLQPYSVKS